MIHVIWTCWLAGRESAPPQVEACLASWERLNPGWELRCLDATAVERYAPLREHLALDRQSVTAVYSSELVGLLLLREFGGVWVDPTLLCTQPLDDWLPGVMDEGFFAFAEPTPDQPLAACFLSADYDSFVIASWCRTAIENRSEPARHGERGWLSDLFCGLCRDDRRVAEAWARVRSASLQQPVAAPLGRGPECFEAGGGEPAMPVGTLPTSFAALSVATENLGDHIQILAGLRMLARLGITPTRYIDRDDEIGSAPMLAPQDGPVGILLNGWFKTNRSEWPPHPQLAPLLLGFHIRLFQCPELASAASIDYFRRHEPIGCRDPYTESLLRSKGVDAFTSNCLSLTLSRRVERPPTQTEVFVVSRDERITARLAGWIGPYTFVSHYSGSSDFDANMARASELLETYRARAKLLVTTLLHCALPAIAMGIPVVVFYPINDEALHASDRERFSALEGLLRVYRFDELEHVDWNPAPVDAGAVKLHLLDRFYALAARWAIPPR